MPCVSGFQWPELSFHGLANPVSQLGGTRTVLPTQQFASVRPPEKQTRVRGWLGGEPHIPRNFNLPWFGRTRYATSSCGIAHWIVGRAEGKQPSAPHPVRRDLAVVIVMNAIKHVSSEYPSNQHKNSVHLLKILPRFIANSEQIPIVKSLLIHIILFIMAFGVLQLPNGQVFVPGTSQLEVNATTTRLKKAGKSDADTVLVPQPSNNPNDPLNWPLWQRDLILLLLCYCTNICVGG